jgi:LysM repeat protein
MPAANAKDITITAIDPAGPSVTCKHAGGVATYTSDNGWQFTQLPRRQSMTEFMGYDGYTMVVPCMFGDGKDRTSIEPQLEVLRGLGRNMVGPRVEPAVVQIDCPAVPLNWLKFIINSQKFNTEYRNNDGSRYFAQVDLTFFEWQPTSLVLTKTGKSATQLLAAALATQNTPGAGGPAGGGTSLVAPTGQGAVRSLLSGATWTVKAGQTLETIALTTLGSATLWQQIGNMNGIRDPTSVTVGQILKLPQGARVPKLSERVPTIQQIVTGQSAG